jgi:hypothetical protein
MPPEPYVPPADEYEDIPEDREEEPRALDARPRDDGTIDLTDPVAQRTARASQKRLDREVAEYWKRQLDDKIGRRALWELLVSFHAFETRFSIGNSGFPCPEATWFQAGESSAGQRLFMSLQRHNFAGAHQMLIEHNPDFAPPKKPKRVTEDG